MSAASGNVLLPRYDLTFPEKSVAFSGAILWNEVPISKRKTESLDSIKINLKHTTVCRKPQNFSFVHSNAVVETVRVQINATPFIFFEADVRTLEIGITA